MNRLINFLNRHKVLTFLLGGLYFLLTVLLHLEVSKISVWFQSKLSTAVYNNMLGIIGLVAVSFFSLYLLNRIRKGDDRKFKILCLSLTITLVVISFNTLLSINIEYIHFLQYAILSIPIFAITLKFGETVFWTTILGTVDEAYQYFILDPDFKYFDFNDVILNLIGGGIGVILILTTLSKLQFQGLYYKRLSGKWFSSKVIIISMVLLLGLLILYSAGYVHFSPGPDSTGASILLRRELPPSAFWISVAWGKTYHVLHPIEGIVLTGILVGFYSFIDFKIWKKI